MLWRKCCSACLLAIALSVVISTAPCQDDLSRYGLQALLDGSGFVAIAPGEFVMGSRDGNADERPPHAVRISRGFEMGRFEVTQAQWVTVMRNAHAKPGAPEPNENPSHFKGPALPVENVSWADVQRFIARLNARDEEHNYRLPTEAEWEYACRSGSTGDHAGKIEEMAWFDGNSEGRTHAVGEKKPNAWGLYDMHGNVSEWVQDWFAPDAFDENLVTDPEGPRSGSYRVYRGGSWHGRATDARSAHRGFDFPNNGYYSVGFRLVRTSK